MRHSTGTPRTKQPRRGCLSLPCVSFASTPPISSSSSAAPSPRRTAIATSTLPRRRGRAAAARTVGGLVGWCASASSWQFTGSCVSVCQQRGSGPPPSPGPDARALSISGRRRRPHVCLGEALRAVPGQFTSHTPFAAGPRSGSAASHAAARGAARRARAGGRVGGATRM